MIINTNIYKVIYDIFQKQSMPSYTICQAQSKTTSMLWKSQVHDYIALDHALSMANYESSSRYQLIWTYKILKKNNMKHSKIYVCININACKN